MPYGIWHVFLTFTGGKVRSKLHRFGYMDWYRSVLRLMLYVPCLLKELFLVSLVDSGRTMALYK